MLLRLLVVVEDLLGSDGIDAIAPDRLATLVAAVMDGLQRQSMLDPEAVDTAERLDQRRRTRRHRLAIRDTKANSSAQSPQGLRRGSG